MGGKAYQLARLTCRGLPVPDGVVVPVRLFEARLRSAGLLDEAKALAAKPDPARAAWLHEQVVGMRVPDALEAELRAAVVRLGGAVAVRSSGLDEDGAKRSFAGQHVSVLNVGSDQVAAAVVRCWASLYSASAVSYRQGAAGPAPGGMAVLLQRMVHPVVAGVMFTVNPLNGSWREMVVEATWGLGDALMSGRVTPHWYLVRRPRRAPRPVRKVLERVRLQVVQQDTPPIAEQWSCAPDGTIARQPTPPSRQDRPTLDSAALIALCRMGLKVEALLGAPQDVEWAIGADGEVRVLQARPITTTTAPRARKDVLWTRRFIGERWPEPATPLGWSITAPVLEHFIAYPDVQARYLGGGPALRLVRSRPYVNVTVFRHLAFKAPGAPPPGFMLEFFPPEEAEEWQRRFAAKPSTAVYGAIFRTTFAERRWRRFRWNPFRNHLSWEVYRQRLDRVLPSLQRVPEDPSDAVRIVERGIELMSEYVGVHVTSLLFANMWYQVLESMLANWVPDRAAKLMDGLATCPPGNLTLATNEALWRLGGQAAAGDLDALEAGQPLSSPFQLALDAFLERFGHRSTTSWEIFSPRWAEQPGTLAPILRAQAQAGVEDPSVRSRQQEEGFRVAEAELRRVAPLGWKRATLTYMVRLTRSYLLLRENQRFWFDRLMFALKQSLSWMGERFAEEGWIASASDVRFLTWPEVRGLAEGALAPNSARAWVERRKVRWEEDRAAPEPPAFLRGDEAVEDVVSGKRLQGLGVSPGRARGVVRVVRTLAEGHLLQRGEVLVARSVDPSWTPLFLTAQAVVLELGSRLSHGAVVAREYRVPAVANIGGVLGTLSDGQEVTVDGTRGVVWVHP